MWTANRPGPQRVSDQTGGDRVQFDLRRGASDGVCPQRSSTERATEPQAKIAATNFQVRSRSAADGDRPRSASVPVLPLGCVASFQPNLAGHGHTPADLQDGDTAGLETGLETCATRQAHARFCGLGGGAQRVSQIAPRRHGVLLGVAAALTTPARFSWLSSTPTRAAKSFVETSPGDDASGGAKAVK